MNNPYDLHSWSTQHRQEALHEARMTQLKGRMRKNRNANSGRGRSGLVLGKALALLAVVGQAGAGRAKTW